MTDIVEFAMTAAGISVSGSVPRAYFESAVQPVMDKLLEAMDSSVGSLHGASAGKAPPNAKLDLSVKTICQRLNAKTGTDLLKAGAVSLALVQGQQQFGRKEILAEAQKAAGYWKASYANDAGRYLTTLQSQSFLIEGASGQLSLSAKAEADMHELLTRDI